MKKRNRFHKLIIYDIKMGFKNNIIKLIGMVIVCLIIVFIGRSAISKNYGGQATVLDYICFMVGGPKYIPENMLSMYVIPVLWLLIQVMIAYIVGYYAVTDLNTYGQQILIRSNSRTKWWISKCIWNISTVIFLYIIIYGITFIVAVISGAKMKMTLTQEIVTSVCNIDMLAGTDKEYIIILLCMPILISGSISIVQMVIALITSPIIGFIISQSIVFFSTIYSRKFLISNYAMLSHNKITCMSTISYKEGIGIGVMVLIVGIIGGGYYFYRCNILPKAQDI